MTELEELKQAERKVLVVDSLLIGFILIGLCAVVARMVGLV